MSEKEVFWQNFFSSTALTPSLDVSLVGESGIAHTFPAIGTGDNRMVLITSEPDPIKAQLIGFDIQKKYKADRVILSRASIADTKDLVSKFAMRFAGGGVETFKVRFEDELRAFDAESIESGRILEKAKGTVFEDVVRSIYFGQSVLNTNIFESVVQFIRECLLLEVHSMVTGGSFDFSALLKRSAYSPEIIEGICPIPIFELVHEDWLTLTERLNPEGATRVLKKIGVQQYFEPPIDQLALLLGESENLSAPTLMSTSSALEEIGHRVAVPELVPNASSIEDLIQHLRDKKYVVEGEYEMQLSESGKQERALVKFRPREAVFFKLVKQFPGIAQLVSALSKGS